ncbi:hypothetical protein ACFSC6_06630 [Rufibacter sediminis]|uniref:Uncharacterized protein n=1 Tax=Rufibacter sediminis TaxID=2762756 RepID=A0ABR6VVX2_9BACT|nr:hypothetical protein [Rufibacter sediminis]MBC3541095.1 hypothetical protein [Rufibacter sediminis]
MRDVFIKVFLVGANILFYYVQQVAAAYVAFWLFGSGETFSRNADKVGVAFLVIHIGLIGYLFYKKRFVNNPLLFTLMALMTIAMYVYLNFYHASDYGY